MLSLWRISRVDYPPIPKLGNKLQLKNLKFYLQLSPRSICKLKRWWKRLSPFKLVVVNNQSRTTLRSASLLRKSSQKSWWCATLTGLRTSLTATPWIRTAWEATTRKASSWIPRHRTWVCSKRPPRSPKRSPSVRFTEVWRPQRWSSCICLTPRTTSSCPQSSPTRLDQPAE